MRTAVIAHGDRPLTAGGEALRVRYDPGRANPEPTGVANFAAALEAELRPRCELVRLQRGTGRGILPLLWHGRQALAAWRDRRCVYLSTESLIVPAILGARAAVTVHDVTPLSHPHRHTWRSRAAQRLLLRLAARRVGAVLVPSRAVRDELLRCAPFAAGKVVIVPEAPRFRGGDIVPVDRRHRTVVYAGTLEPRKNVLPLTRAFLASVAEPWRLVLIGRLGWLSTDERRELDRLCANPRVSRLGYVSDAELRRELAVAGLFAYVSESEGFGLPPLEAMALGTPVIVSDAPALVEVTGGAAAVVRRGPDFERQLGAALRALTTGDEARARLAEQGLRQAGEFDWARTAERVLLALGALRR